MTKKTNHFPHEEALSLQRVCPLDYSNGGYKKREREREGIVYDDDQELTMDEGVTPLLLQVSYVSFSLCAHTRKEIRFFLIFHIDKQGPFYQFNLCGWVPAPATDRGRKRLTMRPIELDRRRD